MAGRARRFGRGLWRVLRAVLRWTLRVVGGLLVLVIVLVLLLLYSNLAFTFAARQGLAFYNGKIPGEVTVEAIEGRLGTSFALRGVRIDDRTGRPLATVDALRVTWSPWALLKGDLALEAVELTGADVYVVSHADGSAWTDLAPEGPKEPDPPRIRPGVGPDLPLDITVGTLTLDDVDVYAGNGRPIAEELRMVLSAHAVGQTAELEIREGRADLPGSRLTGLGLALQWTDPEVVVTAHVATDLGLLTLSHARLDAQALAGEVEVAVIGDREGLAGRTGDWLAKVLREAQGEPLLTISARGSADDLSAEIGASVPGAMAATLTAAGSLTDGPRLFATISTATDIARLVDTNIGVVRPVVSASLTGDPDWQGLRAEVDLRCDACGVLSDVGMWAAMLQEPTETRTKLAVQAVGVSLIADAAFAEGTIRSGELDLTIPDVARPLAVARAFVPKLPEVDGALAVHALCNGDPLLCNAQVDVRAFAGFGARLAALSIAAQGQPFGPVRAADAFLTLEELAIKGQRIAGAEAFVTLGPAGAGSMGQVPKDRSGGDEGGAAVGHQLAKEVAEGASKATQDESTPTEGAAALIAREASETAREGGSASPPLEVGIEAEAWMKRRGRGDRARVIARVRPGPPLEVDVDALSVHLRGLMALLQRPTQVRVDGERISVRGLDLLAAGGRVTADGHVDRGGRSDFDVDVDDVPLAVIGVVVPSLRRRIGGTVGFHAHLGGQAHDPTLSVRADGRKLWFRATEIGDIDVGVDLKDREARTRVTIVGPFADRAEVRVDARLLADLRRGRFALLESPLRVDVDVEQLRLATLRPWLTGARGTVDVHGVVRGTAADPVAALRVSARGLAAAQWQTEGAQVVANVAYAGGEAHGDIDVQHLEAGARLVITTFPVTVDPLRRKFAWRADEPVAATLAVRNFDLWRQLTPMDPGEDIMGKVDVDLAVGGTGAAPEVAMSVRGERLRVRDAELGSLRVDAGYHDERATLAVTGHGGMPGEVEIHAAAPLRIAPAEEEVTWLKDQAHELDVRVAKFDLEGLRAAGVDAPVKGMVGLAVKARGTAADPRIGVAVNVHRLGFRAHTIGSLATTATYADDRLDATVKGSVGDRGKVDVAARVPLAIDLTTGEVAWDRNASHDVHIGLTGIDRSALVPTGAPIPLDALIGIGLEANIKGGLKDFVADVELHGELGHKVFGGAPLHLSAHAEPRSQRVRFALGDHIISKAIEVQAVAKADIPGLAAGTAKARDIAFSATAKSGGVDLRFLKAFTPPGLYDPVGTLVLVADAHGTVGAPEVRGEVDLKDGGITVLALQQRFRDIELKVTGTGKHVEVENFSMRGGEGKLTTTATLDIGPKGALDLDAKAVLSKFPLARPGLPQMQIDATVTAAVDVGAEKTDIDIRVAKSKVLVTGYSVRAPKAIPDNVAVRGHHGELVRPIDLKQMQKEEKAALQEDDGSRMALRIRLTDPVRFTGPATEMEWKGSIAVDKGPGGQTVTGKLRAEEGRFDLLGNRFKIETGEVTLPEGELTIDPFLVVVAATDTPVARVKVTIRGRASRPQMIFSSEPPMAQPQLLTLLLTGSADANEADSQRVLAEAATLLVIAENPALANFVTRSTGLDYVGVSFGETTDQPILTVGKHIDRKIYAETSYKHNAPLRTNRVEARVEYELAPHWTVETFFGDAAVGGVDLFWRKIFGGPPRRKGAKGRDKGGASRSPDSGTSATGP